MKTLIVICLTSVCAFAGALDSPNGGLDGASLAVPEARVKVEGAVFQKASDKGVLLVQCVAGSKNGRFPFASGLVALHGHPAFADLVDGERVAVLAKAAGVYEYTSIQGAARTVRLYEFVSPAPR